MVIDLKRCIGCQTCTAACKLENFIPAGVVWNRLYDYETGKYPGTVRHFVPVPCMQCKTPVCADVCPTKATTQREDGIVVIDYDKCVGCKYCEVGCPYGARQLYEKERFYFEEPIPPEKFPLELRAPHQRHRVGAASKCVFCFHRIDDGEKKGLRPGIDWDATPVCVNACPATARYFGDLDDPASEVSQLIKERRGFPLLREIGTDPSVFYLPA